MSVNEPFPVKNDFNVAKAIIVILAGSPVILGTTAVRNHSEFIALVYHQLSIRMSQWQAATQIHLPPAAKQY